MTSPLSDWNKIGETTVHRFRCTIRTNFGFTLPGLLFLFGLRILLLKRPQFRFFLFFCFLFLIRGILGIFFLSHIVLPLVGVTVEIVSVSVVKVVRQRIPRGVITGQRCGFLLLDAFPYPPPENKFLD